MRETVPFYTELIYRFKTLLFIT